MTQQCEDPETTPCFLLWSMMKSNTKEKDDIRRTIAYKSLQEPPSFLMSDPSSGSSRLESIPNVLLSDLPLRPSSLQWWHQKGFRSTTELQQGLQIHSNGSIIQWAQDLTANSPGFLVRCVSNNRLYIRC